MKPTHRYNKNNKKCTEIKVSFLVDRNDLIEACGILIDKCPKKIPTKKQIISEIKFLLHSDGTACQGYYYENLVNDPKEIVQKAEKIVSKLFPEWD